MSRIIKLKKPKQFGVLIAKSYQIVNQRGIQIGIFFIENELGRSRSAEAWSRQISARDKVQRKIELD